MLTQAIELFTTIAKAAEVPAEVKISRDASKKAKRIGSLAKKFAAALAKIDGPVDTDREVKLQAAAVGFRAELAALGIDVSSINIDPK